MQQLITDYQYYFTMTRFILYMLCYILGYQIGYFVGSRVTDIVYQTVKLVVQDERLLTSKGYDNITHALQSL